MSHPRSWRGAQAQEEPSNLKLYTDTGMFYNGILRMLLTNVLCIKNRMFKYMYRNTSGESQLLLVSAAAAAPFDSGPLHVAESSFQVTGYSMRIGFLTGNDGLFAWRRFLIFIICRIRIREMKWLYSSPSASVCHLLIISDRFPDSHGISCDLK